MTDEELERTHWYTSLAFVAASPLTVWAINHSGFSYKDPFVAHIVFVAFPICLMSTYLLSLIRGPRMALLTQNPTQSATNILNTDPIQFLKDKAAWLTRFHFDVQLDVDARVLYFEKQSERHNHGFLTESFTGDIRVETNASSTVVGVTVTMRALELIGDGHDLKILADFLCGRSERYTRRTVPFLLICSICMCYLISIAGLGRYYNWGVGEIYFLPSHAVATGCVIASAIVLLRDRERLFGLRLCVVGVYLSLLPAIAWLIR